MTAPRIIKKYPNRRLYDTETSTYITLAEEKPHSATTLFGAAEALREKAQEPMADYEHAEYAQSVSRLRSMLAEAEFNTLWAAGRSPSGPEVIWASLSSRSRGATHPSASRPPTGARLLSWSLPSLLRMDTWHLDPVASFGS